MYSFIICIIALIAGYIFYGRFIDKVFGPDASRRTPAVTKADGVDFIPMPTWRVYMIQFLNIAGTGPIFGAIMGAKFGPASYLWIVLGSIFAGAVHDYLSGMISIRSDGAVLPTIVGNMLGKGMKSVMLVVSLVLLLLVGTVFVYSPALILDDLAPLASSAQWSVMIWVLIIFVYYIFATLLPVDKLIGRIYPLFAFSLIFMAVGLMVCLFVKWPAIPEFWQGLYNRGPEIGMKGRHIFPALFITIACGAISGFHGTQSPIMARCVKNETMGRRVFYGAMITEGIVALIWAAVASTFYFAGGADEVGLPLTAQAPEIVNSLATAWLGTVGAILAIIGVVAAPITSGDTAFRSARLIIAESLHIDQKKHTNRLAISIPIFFVTSFLLWFNVANEDGFNIIWRYFGLANQVLAAITLWTCTVYLHRSARRHMDLITLIPAAFITSVCVTFIFVSKIGFNVTDAAIPYVATIAFVLSFAIYHILASRQEKCSRN